MTVRTADGLKLDTIFILVLWTGINYFRGAKNLLFILIAVCFIPNIKEPFPSYFLPLCVERIFSITSTSVLIFASSPDLSPPTERDARRPTCFSSRGSHLLPPAQKMPCLQMEGTPHSGHIQWVITERRKEGRKEQVDVEKQIDGWSKGEKEKRTSGRDKLSSSFCSLGRICASDNSGG